MRHAGDSRTFIAAAAVLMAGLVIATMLAINAKLQSALSPTVEQAGAPVLKVGPSAGPPVLQNTAAPSIANSGTNSGDNAVSNAGAIAGSNSVPATTHVAVTPAPRAVRPAAKTPAPSLAAGAKAAQPTAAPVAPAPPAPPVAGAQPPTVTAPAPVTTLPAVRPTVTPVPVPVVVVTPPALVPALPTLVAEATATVTVAPDLGDAIASTGETHHRRHDKGKSSSSSGPDLKAAPARHDSTADPRTRDEDNDGDDDDSNVSTQKGGHDSLTSLLTLIFPDDSHPAAGHD